MIHTSGFHGNQVGDGGNARTRNSRSSGMDGNDHSAGKVDQGSRAGFKNPL